MVDGGLSLSIFLYIIYSTLDKIFLSSTCLLAAANFHQDCHIVRATNNQSISEPCSFYRYFENGRWNSCV